MILVAEIGDRTFFIAAIMAMKQYAARAMGRRARSACSSLSMSDINFSFFYFSARLVVFSAAIAALFLMTVLSVVLGYALPNLIPRVYTYYLALAFFAVFGVRMLRDWRGMSDDEGQEELAETEDELKEAEADAAPQTAIAEMEEGKAKSLGKGSLHDKSLLHRFLLTLLPAVWVQTFVLTFLAEWGDRSQLTTIAMASAQNPWGITLGGVAGHAVCTSIAVIGGRMLAQRISVKTVTLFGAILFLLFAVIGFIQGPDIASSLATEEAQLN